MVGSHALGDFVDVGTGGLTDGGDSVDVADFEGEKAVGSVFDQLGAVEVGDNDGGVEGGVNFLHGGGGALAADADDDAVGFHQVGHSAAFAEEFRIADDVELDAGFAVAADGVGDFFPGFNRDRAFIDNHAVFGHDLGDAAGDFFDIDQIDAAVFLGRGGDGDEDDLGSGNGVLDGGSEGKASGLDVFADQFLETGFVDGDFARLELGNFFFVVVHADDAVTDVGKARSGHESDVAGTDDG